MFQRFGIRRHKHGTSKRKTTNRRLGSEGLEGRTMMSATPMSLGAATDIPAAEFEGLAQQEAAELRNLAAMGSTAAAASMSPPKPTSTLGAPWSSRAARGTTESNW